MIDFIFHPSKSRGHADHGWLNTWHSFSFASFYDPNKIHFGMLRVLNEDIVSAGNGFGLHPHDNMEIITIPLKGKLLHKDSMGNEQVINVGEVQVMSAGTGIHHSEINPDSEKDVHLLQIWVFPRQKNLKPRYEQRTFDPSSRINNFQNILKPGPANEGLWIHQDAWFYLYAPEKDYIQQYTLNKTKNGIYIFIIKGKIKIMDYNLQTGDGLGIKYISSVELSALENSEVLIMEVPL